MKMNRRVFLKSCVSALGGLGLGGWKATCRAAAGSDEDTHGAPPNIVFILADDMGYGDIQAYNPASRIPTPNLNQLASDGMRFTDAHSGSAVCTPTRYGILTGRYCWRTRLQSGVLFPPDDEPLIEPGRLTVAGMLKRRGYHTACIGKWHLGIEWGRDDAGTVDFSKPIRHGPTDVGFDEYFGIAASLDMVPYAFYHNRNPVEPVTETQEALGFPRFIRQGPKAPGFDPGKVLDTLTERAVGYIRTRARRQERFFLYLPLTAPHKPVWPADRFAGKTAMGPYGDFVHQVDDSVGRVLRAIEQAGVAGNTLVVYTSDNGSFMYRRPQEIRDHTVDAAKQHYHPDNHQANGSLRGTKADVWEGGHRIPFVVRWPGRVKPSSECDQTICLTDFFATCAEIVRFDMPPNAGEDSFSLMGLLAGRGWLRAPVVHHSANGVFALRQGKWKMVFGNGSGGREQPVGKPFARPYALFDMEQDPSETTNVIESYPQVAAQLEQALARIRDNPSSRL